ncbi:MAG: alpha/beta hydrolase [Xanthomonadales bacterium]|nr:alpha/beta hydrolase [Xanthomonadales bacterium]
MRPRWCWWTGSRAEAGGAAGPLAILAVPPLSRVVEHFAYRRLLAPDRFAASLASAYGRPPSAEEVEGYLRPLRIAGTTPAVLRYGAHGARVERLPREVLLIWGRQDRWVPPAVAERFRARHPEARLAWIEEAGHNPMETHPRAFHDLLLAFLRERIPRAADGER